MPVLPDGSPGLDRGPVPGELVCLRVPAALHGERLDRGLALLTGITRSQAARLVTEGLARVAGRPVRSGSRRLNQGELLEVPISGPSAAGTGATPRLDGGTLPHTEALVATVVFEDESVLVVDKPAGLVVHPGAGHHATTLSQQLLALYPDLAAAGPDEVRPGIVHRIDKGTSGLLMVARTPEARQHLGAQLAEHSVDRRYLAVVHGDVAADQGLVDAPLGRGQRDRVKVTVVEGGRYARTHYRTLSRASDPLPVSLLACRLDTGRTHQVRAHMAAIRHPVLMDDCYAKPRQLQAARQIVPDLARPWLHAAHLGFSHPDDGRWMSFLSPVPLDLADALSAVGLRLPEPLGALADSWPSG